MPAYTRKMSGAAGENKEHGMSNTYRLFIRLCVITIDEFASYHTGGAHFLLGDGAVRFISTSIDLGVYRSLASRSAGDITGEF